jgi:hypothetical protein
MEQQQMTQEKWNYEEGVCFAKIMLLTVKY